MTASMITERLRGAPLRSAALLSAAELDAALGGLNPTKREALELTLDAALVALGRAVYESGGGGTAARGAADRRDAPASEMTLVAMSGGVDSSVVAALSARDGLDAWGVTLELWRDRDNDERKSCCSASAVRAARSQAHSLGIPHLTLDLRGEFRGKVVEPFLRGHARGVTPNPCVACNGELRLDAMLSLADALGARELATGHYARVWRDGEGALLRAARDPAKDQSYMLAAVRPETLQRLRLPLGEMSKLETRELAAELGLSSAEKPDSQDLCFLAGTTREAFLARHGGLGERPGEIVRRDGRVVGSHRGTHTFTVGQRRGIGVSGGEPLYVLELRPREREVVVGTRSELSSAKLTLRGARLYRDGSRVTHARLRYHAEPIPCRLEAGAGRHARLEISLESPAEAVSPGQSACLLSGDLVVGVATISA